MKKIITWLPRIIAAIIMLQTLYFKFGGAEESIYIFSTLGIEPWGRYGSGIIELIASTLLLTGTYSGIGAILGMGTMFGAIMSHLTILGIEVKGDGGYLFGLAVVVLICCGMVAYKERAELKAIFFGGR